MKKTACISAVFFLSVGLQDRALALSDNAERIVSQILSCQLNVAQAALRSRALSEQDFVEAAQFIEKEGVEVVRDNGRVIPKVSIFGLPATDVRTVAAIGVLINTGSFGAHPLDSIIAALKNQNIALEKTSTPEMGVVYKMEKWAGQPNKSARFEYLLFQGTVNISQGMKFERSKNNELGFMCSEGGGPGSAQ